MQEIISVSDYLNKLNKTLREDRVKLVGEVSEVKKGPSGHVYFSLKDENGGALISCIIWNSKYNLYGIELKDGIKIYATGSPNIYAPSGRLSFIADIIELAGEGALQLAYEKLKKKLETEGLFAESRKRELPSFPQKIGVITSKNGAVINDFLTNIGKYGFQISFVDSRVEGQEAIDDLLASIHTLKTKNIDVLVIMRGGGSLESFMAFNNEVLVREIAKFPVPVLTGIGHDKDVPLVAMVSDKNVSTPTAVANLLNSSWNDALFRVNLAEQKLFSNFSSLLEIFKKAEQTVLHSLTRIESGILRMRDTIKQSSKDLTRSFETTINQTYDFLKSSEKLIDQGDPRRQLSKGYSIVRFKGKVLRSVKNVKKNDKLDISLSDGIIESQITLVPLKVDVDKRKI